MSDLCRGRRQRGKQRIGRESRTDSIPLVHVQRGQGDTCETPYFNRGTKTACVDIYLEVCHAARGELQGMNLAAIARGAENQTNKKVRDLRALWRFGIAVLVDVDGERISYADSSIMASYRTWRRDNLGNVKEMREHGIKRDE